MCTKWLHATMQVLKSKCTTHDQVLFLPFILVIFCCSLCFYVLHLYSTFILWFHEAMAPFQVPKNFKFKLFFSGEPNVTSNLFPHIAFSVQVASNNTISPSWSSNPESRRNGKEHVEFVEPLEKKPQRSYEKTHVFQDMWAYHFPWVKIVVGEDGLVA